MQDLAETDNLDNLDYFGGHTNKPNHPRQQKAAHYSSVSSRQREGGSLPTNVNVSYGCTVHEPPFINDIKHKKKGKISKQQQQQQQDQYGGRVGPGCGVGIGGIGINAITNTDESHSINDIGRQSNDTIIDMGEFDSDETQQLLAHDSLAQVKGNNLQFRTEK